MPLLFLHGPPATGKFTVGRELAALTGWELFHNHLVVDEVLRDHAFGTPAFVAERDRRWREHLAAAGKPDRGVIFTFNPENSVPQAFIDWLFRALPEAGCAVLSVGLTAPEEVIEARLGSDSRQRFRKLVDLDLYRALRATGTFTSPRIPRSDLVLDTAVADPRTTAAAILRHFRLG